MEFRVSVLFKVFGNVMNKEHAVYALTARVETQPEKSP